VGFKLLLYLSGVGRIWSSTCLWLVFYKCAESGRQLVSDLSFINVDKLDIAQTGWRVIWSLSFKVSTKSPSKFSHIWNRLVWISKYFEVLRVFKSVNLIVGEKVIWCGLLVRLHGKASWSLASLYGYRAASLLEPFWANLLAKAKLNF